MLNSCPTSALTVDAAGEDVPPGADEVQACVAGGELLDDLRGDQRQLVAGPVAGAGAERAGVRGVAVAFQAAPGEGTAAGDDLHGRFGGRSDRDLLDGAGQPGRWLDAR
jgi:hypothetical protein